MKPVFRFGISVLPLALTPGLVWLLAEGYVNLGGGEKDILMALPWMVWSAFFAAAFFVATRKGYSLSTAVLRAVSWATGLIIFLWLMLWITTSDWLGT